MLFLHVHVQIVTLKHTPHKLQSKVQCHVKLPPWKNWHSSPRSVECQEAAAGADNFNSLTALSHLFQQPYFFNNFAGCIYFR